MRIGTSASDVNNFINNINDKQTASSSQSEGSKTESFTQFGQSSIMMNSFSSSFVKSSLLAMTAPQKGANSKAVDASVPSSSSFVAVPQNTEKPKSEIDKKIDSVIYGDAPPKSVYYVDKEKGEKAYQTLKQGDEFDTTNPDAVKMLQRSLIFLGYANATTQSKSVGAVINGKYDQGTQETIKTFQKEVGLPQTGKLDLATSNAIYNSVKSRVQTLPSSATEEFSKVADKSIDKSTFLKNNYENIEKIASKYDIPPDVLYGFIYKESDSGNNNFPRLEKGHLKDLTAVRDRLKENKLNKLDPSCPEDVKIIDALFNKTAQLNARGSILYSMIPEKPTTVDKLATMKQLANFNDQTLRELSTSYGYVQIMGWQTLDVNWQKNTSKTSTELLSEIKSPNPESQIESSASFVKYGQNGSEYQAAKNHNYSLLAEKHNGKGAAPSYQVGIREGAVQYNLFAAQQQKSGVVDKK
jgi:peptidoglycan hydrolase-like protein with peptidoglycan-binding domain